MTTPNSHEPVLDLLADFRRQSEVFNTFAPDNDEAFTALAERTYLVPMYKMAAGVTIRTAGGALAALDAVIANQSGEHAGELGDAAEAALLEAVRDFLRRQKEGSA